MMDFETYCAEMQRRVDAHAQREADKEAERAAHKKRIQAQNRAYMWDCAQRIEEARHAA